MPIQFGCRCGQKIITEEAFAGKTVRCPKCGVLLRIPTPRQRVQGPAPAHPPSSVLEPALEELPDEHIQAYTPPQSSSIQPEELPLLEEEVEEEIPVLEEVGSEFDKVKGYQAAEARRKRPKDQENKQKKRLHRAQLKTTSAGIGLMYWGIVCQLVFYACVFLTVILGCIFFIGTFSSAVAADEMPSPPPPFVIALFVLLRFIGFFSTLAFSILYFIGCLLCCWSPPKAGGRPYIVTAVWLMGASVVSAFFLAFMFIFAVVTSGATDAVRVVTILGMVILVLNLLLGAASMVLSLLFVRRMALYADERAAGNELMSVLFGWVRMLIALPFLIAFCYLLLFVIYAQDLRVTAVFALLAIAIDVISLMIFFGYWIVYWIRLMRAVGAIWQALKYEFAL